MTLGESILSMLHVGLREKTNIAGRPLKFQVRGLKNNINNI